MSINQSNDGTIEVLNTGHPSSTLMRIPLEQIVTDPQVRNVFDPEEMAGLTESLIQTGQIVPILAYYDRDREKYVIVDGERRFRAAKAAGFPELTAVVCGAKPMPDEIVIAQLTIDAQRKDLDPIDQALGYQKALETCNFTATELASRLQVAHTTITRAISLLDLPQDLLDEIRAGRLSPGIARQLVRLPKKEDQHEAWKTVQAKSLTAEQTQKLVNKLLNSKKKRGRPKSNDNLTFKHLGGYEAVLTPKKITLVLANPGKPRTREQMLSAIELLAIKLREEIAKETSAGTPANV